MSVLPPTGQFSNHGLARRSSSDWKIRLIWAPHATEYTKREIILLARMINPNH